MYVHHAVEIFREVWRVLRDDGTLWLNLGDSYATGVGAVGEHPGGGAQGSAWRGRPSAGATSSAGHRGIRAGSSAGKQEYSGIGPMTQPNRMPQPGLKPKDLCGIPWRVAFALQEDGWWLRQDNIWAKPNPMPESVTDRCTKSHEYFFMLAKGERYYFDQDAILEPLSEGTHLRVSQATLDEQYGSDKVPGKTNGPMTVSLRGFKAGKPGSGIKNNESMNAALVAPGRSGNKARKPASDRGVPEDTGKNQAGSVPWEGYQRNKRSVWTVTTVPFGGEFCRACQTYFEGDALNDLRVERIKDGDREMRRRWCSCGKHDQWLSHFATFPPTLIEPAIKAGCPAGGLVLDPFGGAGTTGMAADRLARDAVLIEINPEYAEMARQRLALDAGPMFGDVRIEQAKEAAE